MADTESLETKPAVAAIVPLERARQITGRSFSGQTESWSNTPRNVTFDRVELRRILDAYGRGVAAGEWKDYALDFGPQKSVFTIFRRTSEAPLYRIEKVPALSRKQGAFAIVTVTGLVLRRGNDLARVLAIIEKKTLALVR